jgi:hypothetical protein
MWEQHTVRTLFDVSPQNCVLNTRRQVLQPASQMVSTTHSQTLYITAPTVRFEVLRNATVNSTVFRDVTLHSWVADVAMIHRTYCSHIVKTDHNVPAIHWCLPTIPHIQHVPVTHWCLPTIQQVQHVPVTHWCLSTI